MEQGSSGLKRSLLILSILVAISSAVFAASSTNYYISMEVIDTGGASMDSTSYNMNGMIRDKVVDITTSSSYTLEGRFLPLVIIPTVIPTFERPSVTAIIPNSVGNDALYFFIINGSQITTEPSHLTANLTKTGQTPITGTIANCTDATSFECSFSMTGAQVGLWNVVVSNIGYGPGRTGTLTSGLTVTSSGPLRIIGTPTNEPNPFNPDDGPTHIVYTLSAAADISIYMFDQSGNIVWRKEFSRNANGGLMGANVIPWDGVSGFSEKLPTGVYILRILTRGGNVKELGRIKIAILRQ